MVLEPLPLRISASAANGYLFPHHNLPAPLWEWFIHVFLGAKAPLGLVHVMLCYVNPKKFQNCLVLLKLLDNLGFVKGVKNITRGFLIARDSIR